MCGGYTLEWLDALITVSLNPAKTDFNAIQPVNSIQLKSKIEEEKDKIQSFLKSKVFSLGDEKKIELLIKQYHSSLIILLDQALENHVKCPAKITELKQLTNDLIACIDELLSFIELRFLDYLSLNERVPATYLSVAKKDITQRLDKLKANLNRKVSGIEIIDIVLHDLYAFIGCSKDEHPFIFREIFYIKEICKELKHLDNTKCESNTYTCLDELLIYMNFNSKHYIANLTQRLATKINSYENISDKMEMLLFHFKTFKQMPHKSEIIFNSTYSDLSIELSNWFTQEIFYFDKKMHYAIVPLEEKEQKPVPKNKEKEKLLSILTVDQMALILRAADELKIVTARSLNSVFKSIVPYLSTPYQENISYDSMRSKSYSAEIRDKEIVIETLQQMIKRINEY